MKKQRRLIFALLTFLGSVIICYSSFAQVVGIHDAENEHECVIVDNDGLTKRFRWNSGSSVKWGPTNGYDIDVWNGSNWSHYTGASSGGNSSILRSMCNMFV